MPIHLLRGFVLLAPALPALAQYAAPAILSRGELPAGMSTMTDGFTYSLTLASKYTNAVAGIFALRTQGPPANPAAFGGGLAGGITASRHWEHSHLALNYSGGLRDYSQATFYSGLSQGVLLDFSHLFSPHVAWSVRESAGMFSQFGPTTGSLDSPSTVPAAAFYDARTLYSTTRTDLTLQHSSRLSFDLGGGFFLNEARSSALYGAQGEMAMGDVQYRLSPHVTIGADYTFSHYNYTRGAGAAAIHATAFTAAWRVSRWTELSFFAGPSRMDSRLAQAGADPSNSTQWKPNYGIRFARSFQHGVAYVNGGEAVIPGNGLFLTSSATTVTAGYRYLGLRDWNLSVAAAYKSALSLGNVTGRYEDVIGSYRLSRQIVGALSFVSSFEATRYQSASFAGYNRLIYTASMGFAFSSHNLPPRFF